MAAINNIFVLFHANCTDGTGAKFAAWKKFGDKANYIPVKYGQEVPKGLNKDSEVYIVDFSYDRETIIRLQELCKSVTILDHHKTAEEALRGLPGATFDMGRSGCVMAWEYFHPGVPVPELLLDIQDRDLWLFKRPNSKATHAGIHLLKNEMSQWDDVANRVGAYLQIVSIGKYFLEHQDSIVKSAVKSKVKIINFLGYRVGITNATDYASEIGNAICLDKGLAVDFGIVYCITNEDKVLLSLRSIKEDVSKIAKMYGGGGHILASGMSMDIDTFLMLLNNQLIGELRQ